VNAAAFNLEQLAGSQLKDWKPSSSAPSIPALTIQPEENRTMTFRSELRAAIAAAGALTYVDIEQAFPGRNIATPLSQMTTSKQLKRQGHGKDAIYTIGKKGEAKVAAAADRPAKRARKAARAGKKTRRKNSARNLDLPRLTRGGHIEGAIEELRQRREGIDQAIAVLEALA
jgi:hypothetical protein